jgi:hypothetical protein
MWGLLAAGQYQAVSLGESAKTITLYGPSTSKTTKQLAVVATPVDGLTYLVEHRVYSNTDRNGIYVVSFSGSTWELRVPLAKYPLGAGTKLEAGQTFTGAGGAVRIYVQSTSSTSSTIVVNGGTQPYVSIGSYANREVMEAASGGVQKLVKTNQSTWTATVPSTYSSWLSVTPTSGTNGTYITINRTANTGTTTRIGRIDFKAGTTTWPYWVVQAGTDECGAAITSNCVWTPATYGSSSLTKGLQTYYDRDYLKITAPATGSWRFEASVTPLAADVSAYLLDSAGNQIGSIAYGSPYHATTRGFSATWSLTAGQVYYLDIHSNWSDSNSNPATPYTITATSPAVPAVTIGAVTVTGTTSVGSQLTATASSVVPTSAVLSYQWYRASTSTGSYTAISGATDRYYTLTSSDDGRYIKVRVTGKAIGYADGTRDSDPKLIGTGTCAVSSVTVTGSHVVGQAETASVSATAACTGRAYQWYRSTSSTTGFTAISGATGQTYTPVAGDLNYYVRVSATVSASGYTSATGTSAAVRINQGTITIGSVTISGTPRVGSQLTATANSVSPSNASLAYQWYRGSSLISGQTSRYYTPTTSDVNQSIWVRVTATLTGYATTTKDSATVTVSANACVVGAANVSGTAKVEYTLTATASNVTPTECTGRIYQWYRGSTAISGATASTYKLVAADAGYAVKVRITATGSGLTSGYKDSSAYTVAKGTPTIGTVSVSGTAKVAYTLTASVSSYTPAGAAVTYQWYRGSTAISGATATTYTAQPADAGYAVKVRVTVAATGYDSLYKDSSAYTVAKGTPTIGTVSISGTAKVTYTLTASVASYTPAGATVAYQWYRGSTAISGATGRTYVAQPADATYAVKVRVTVTATGYDSLYKDSATVTVAKGTPTIGTVSVSGTAKVGNTLTASVSSYTPSGATVTYQWYRGSGTISGATANTYTLVAADSGYAVKVRATVTATGYDSLYKDSSTVTVQPGTPTLGTLSIAGTAVVGSTLTATLASYTPAGATVTYQWYRSSVPIDGATARTYKVLATDVGYVMKIRATVSATGYTAAYKETSTTSVVAATATISTVSISGTARVGYTLTCSVSGYSPSGATISYQWYRAGVAINGATARTYVILSQDIGQALVCRATLTTAGYTTIYKDSASLTPATTAAAISSVTIGGTKSVGNTLTASVSGLSPAGASVSFDWYRGSTLVQSGSGRQYTLVAADLNQTIKVKATVSAPGYTNATRESSATTTIAAGSLSYGTVTVSGVPRVGTTQTASLDYVLPATASISYQWERGGVAISGATSKTYALAADDAGKYIRVKVTLKLAGYTDAVLTSSQVLAVASNAVGLGPVLISGPAAQGYAMTASVNGYLPSSATLTYQWYRGSTAITGATGKSYTPVAADAAQTIKVRVTGTYSGYTSNYRDSTALTVAGSGTGVAGRLVASDGGSVADYRVAYDNYTCDGATDYKTPADDFSSVTVSADNQFAVGKYSGECYRLIVRTKAGVMVSTTWNGSTGTYQFVPAGSRNVQITVPTKIAMGDVTVTGTLAVGQTLYANVANLVPDTATLTYQWLRGTTVIPGATSYYYVPSVAEAGISIRVQVTASVPGWSSLTKNSTLVAVSAADGGVAGKVTASDGGSLSGWRLAYDNYTCATKTDLRTPSDDYVTNLTLAADGSFKAGMYAGECYKVWLISPTGNAVASTWGSSTANYHYVPSGTRNLALSVPTKATLEAVNVTGTGAVGSILTASAVNYVPLNAAVAYQWYRGSTAISGATSYRYTLVAADAGQSIKARATISLGGLTSTYKDSNTVVPVGESQGVTGQVQLYGGGSLTGYRVYYDNYTCDGLTDIKTPTDDYSSQVVGPTGQFQVGKYAGDCYRLEVRNASGTVINSTVGSTTARYQYVATGTRNLILRIALP